MQNSSVISKTAPSSKSHLHDPSQFSRQKLMTSQEALHIIFERAPVIYTLNDDQGTLIDVNQAALELIGSTREELLGKNLFKLKFLRRSQLGTISRRLSRAAARKPVEKHEFDLILRDGKRLILESTLFPVSLDGQTLILAIAADVTASKISTENSRKQRAKLKTSHKELKHLSRRLICVREEERKTLSSVLHNEAGALAGLLKCRLNTVQKEIQAGRTETGLQGLNESLSLVNRHVEVLKKFAVAMRPPDLDKLSLPEVLKNYYSESAEKTGLNIVFRFGLNGHEIKNHKSIIIYRIAQEALNNIINHAEAKRVTMSLTHRDSVIRLRVADDGRGFNPHKNLKSKKIGLGLLSMKEMAECVGGRFVVRSTPGKGTTVSVAFPVRNGVSSPEK